MSHNSSPNREHAVAAEAAANSLPASIAAAAGDPSDAEGSTASPAALPVAQAGSGPTLQAATAAPLQRPLLSKGAEWLRANWPMLGAIASLVVGGVFMWIYRKDSATLILCLVIANSAAQMFIDFHTGKGKPAVSAAARLIPIFVATFIYFGQSLR